MFVKVSPFSFAHESTRRCRQSTTPRRSGTKRATTTTALLAPPDRRRVALFYAPLDDRNNAIIPFFDPSTLPPPPPSAGLTSIQSFEPVLNVEAASSFAFIAVVFAILQLRINAVSAAARRRSAALSALRAAESAQLSDPATSSGDRGAVVSRAKVEYESALREELGLRTILPGVRIVAPNDPNRDEEERANAKRFLGWGREEFGDDDGGEEGNIIGSTGGSRGSVVERGGDGDAQKDERSDDVGLSAGAKIILFGVASMLIVLLWTLSFDPMATDTGIFG